uniref:VCBS repeat-containing protein n=1 Tax=uncultured organism MedDCM-OCT-S01-C81 TaxID=743603 RepID=D6PJL0_9ZZZZ|nr:hypothetical protein [uncultured organism MedDCM-OCT-S01-C81]
MEASYTPPGGWCRREKSHLAPPKRHPLHLGVSAKRIRFHRAAPLSNELIPGRSDKTLSPERHARELQAQKLLEGNGVVLREGGTYVLQIDQDPPPKNSSSAERSRYLRRYTGQTAVFRFKNGSLQEIEGPLRSAAHPGQKRAQGFTDVNGDGRDDIAHLRSGVYTYHAKSFGGRFNPINDHSMKVARDLNQDGTIDALEGRKARREGHYATGLQWHAGTSTRPSSVGCQTMPPQQYQRFRLAIESGKQSTFTYLLLRRANEDFGANPF